MKHSTFEVDDLVMLPGMRARIGVIHLSTAMMDHEFYEMAADGVSIFCTRLRGHPPTLEGLKDAAKDLIEIKPQSVLYGCTSGSFGPGPKWNDQLIKTMEEVLGCPATTNSQGVVEALKALGAKKVSVTTPYNDEYTMKLKSFLEAKGFQITNIKRVPVYEDDFGKFLFPPEKAYQIAVETYTPDADAHFISCAGWRTLPIIEKLEADIGRPVISSVQAVMWHAMKLADIKVKMEGKGKLLQL
jgi:maleate cis-trans isomerase